MTSRDQPAGPSRRPAVARLLWLSEAVAVIGGILALSIALLVTVNVLGRWMLNAPVNGDVELVQVGTALAIFAYMPYTQARRGNIMVDTFTGFLPLRTRNLMDAFWDLVFAAFMGFCSVGLTVGTREFWTNGQATQQLLIPVWPVALLCALLCALLVLTAILTAIRLVRGG